MGKPLAFNYPMGLVSTVEEPKLFFFKSLREKDWVVCDIKLRNMSSITWSLWYKRLDLFWIETQ